MAIYAKLSIIHESPTKIGYYKRKDADPGLVPGPICNKGN